ncbi:MAG: 16S rRNA (cytidine(1402)-2'-O)-methyltransferase [Blastocatellia bacterium]|nr:16S rRNA (cytidine(1402)-2'-O)-methyltransferase [Blastocatellia bacterium]
MPGTLYLVATPIGNLKDITYRAVEVLSSVDVIACEDTRHTRKLLNHLGITNKLVSYHDHNEAERATELIAGLENGKSVALVSDAGTPGISDPGYRLVQRAIEVGVAAVSIPGAVAFVAAVVVSGLPTDAVFFGGFLPSKKAERRNRLREVSEIPATLAFYESPRRMSGTLADCLEILGDRSAAVGREITKLHEEFSRGTLSQLHSKFSSATFKGETVLLIDRVRGVKQKADPAFSLMGRLAAIEAEGVDPKAALKLVAREFGISKSEAYRIVQSDRK